ncbi:radical SAM protein [bacterium]|nr:radical SAM protein [bacterium]
MPATDRPPAPQTLKVLRKRVSDDAPITARSAVLFRFGEQCNYHCPMCSNTGERALFFRDTDELLRRAAFLHGLGFRRAVITGGEATIHPGFWTVVERLFGYGMVWDTNTHGRTYATPGFATRAVSTGLRRAIVSLHSHIPATSAAIFGTREASHHGTVAGIEQLLAAGVAVMVNCVLNELNLPHLEEYVSWARDRFGPRTTFKLVFPSTIGKGGGWSAIAALRFRDVRDTMQRLRAQAAARGTRLFFESFPSCVLGDARAHNLGRSAFGESHYLDDATGDRVYSMRHIEAQLSGYGEHCRDCAALRRCPGVALAYLRRHGDAELVPFTASDDVAAPGAVA